MKYDVIPIIISTIIFMVTLVLTFLLQYPILTSLVLELTLTSLTYLFLILTIRLLRPKKIDLEEIFTSGVAKPPYLFEDELYRFRLPMEEEKSGE